MNINDLSFNCTDIKKLRKEKGLSSREVADAIDISLSYYSLIENGKRNLSLDLYKKIINTINNINTKSSIDLFENTKSKINNILTTYLENNKMVRDYDGINAIKELILLYNQNTPHLLVKDTTGGIYNKNSIEIHNYQNKVFTFDKERFEKSLLNDDNEEFLESLVIPTKEGFYIDCYSIDSNLSNFYNGLPIIINGIYEIKQDKNRCVGKLDFIVNLGHTIKLHLIDISNKSLGYFNPFEIEFLKYKN